MSLKHLFFVIGLVLMSCTDVDLIGLDPSKFTNNGDGGGGAYDALCEGVDSSFSTKVLPILEEKCSNGICHAEGSSSGGLNLDSDDDTLGDTPSGVIGNIKRPNGVDTEINVTTAEQSPLLLKPLADSAGGQGGTHTGGTIFNNTDDPDYKTILCWIGTGTKNDLTESTCTFGEHVYPVFKARGCSETGCHDVNNPAGLDLNQSSTDVYNGPSNGFPQNADVVIPFDQSSLILKKPTLNGVTHTGGSVFDGTTDSDYLLLSCWIDEGALEN